MKLARYQKFDRMTDIPLDLLKQSGITCVMIDMDSTLLVWHGEEILPAERMWCESVMALGIEIIIVSNALRERTKIIAEQIGVKCVAPAMKPFPFGLWKAAGIAKSKIKNCVMIGDQMITDKIAAMFAGVKFILVEPLSNVEFGMTKVNRKLEKFFFGRDTDK